MVDSFVRRYSSRAIAAIRPKNRIPPTSVPMVARALSIDLNGIEAFPVEVEVNCGWGDTVIVLMGL